MCFLCSVTENFDPGRHSESSVYDPASWAGVDGTDGGTILTDATIIETSDAAADDSTSYSFDVGDVFNGTLDSAGDRDWVAITLEEGQNYTINLTGTTGGLADPYLRLYDSNGTLLEFNDDINYGAGIRDSSIDFTATSSGVYYLSAGSYQDSGTGDYTLEVYTFADASLDTLANYLTDGFWQDNGYGRHSFNTSSDNTITVDITGLTANGQQFARWALEAWEMVADITFAEVNSGADITFDDEDLNSAYALSETSGSTTLSSDINVGRTWISGDGTRVDSYSFATYIHEIGHSLGLGHQGFYNGNATFGADADFANDSWQLSVMSYFSQTENPYSNASYAAVISAMMADIIAVQNLYGAAGSGSATSGNTTWGANSNLGGYWGEFFDAYSTGTTNAAYGGGAVSFTIYDQGGTDMLDLSFSTYNNVIDMRDQHFSDVGGLTENIGIARGTVLENLTNGSGNDEVLGNSANNRISGNAGNDTINAGAGNDTIYGGGSYDVLYGGSGNDHVYGGRGRDTVELGSGNDRYWDTGQGGTHGRDNISGQGGNDIIRGGGGNDTLNGGSGVDRLWAGNGNDSVIGGNGRDRVFLGNGNDIFTDSAQTGYKGSDRVFGGGGNDRITLSGGDDTVSGGRGEDSFIFTGSNIEDDQITDYATGTDDLRFDDALWGGGSMTASQVVTEFATVSGGDVVFDFGASGTVTLVGVDTLTGLSDDISIF